ncbi:nuclear transport factor 2 family protein [Chitinophaga ginsengisegetis]|uniref:SnoaL-like domain-containing protein n=1 Tax=Chitinophaga ginsengisegetis TaxID=393003 RepID=UPI003424074F
MTVEQIAARLTGLCREEKFDVAQKELYADDAVSIEPYAIPGFEKETRGLEALIEKDKKFSAMVEARYGTVVSPPLIAGNVIAFTLTMDIKLIGRDRIKMNELCVYHVKDGKIISEQFFM